MTLPLFLLKKKGRKIMATFINFESDGKIKEEKQKEFSERLKKLLSAGGMMDYDVVELYNQAILLLKPIDYNEKGSYWFSYNYFEEAFWEDAGFNGEDGYFYSNTVGWGPFNWTIKAANILQELYTDGFTVVKENSKIIFKEKAYCLSWINYLFDESYSYKNWDQWQVYMHVKDDEDYIRQGFESDCSDHAGKYPIISYYEVKAVDKGFSTMVNELKRDTNITIHNFKIGVIQIREIIKDFKVSSSLSKQGQIDLLVAGINHLDHDYDNFIMINHDNEDFVDFMQFNKVLIQSKVLALKAVSEVYEVDFWQLYNCLENRERLIEECDRVILEMPAYQIRTQLIFNLSPDDLLYYFQEGDEDKFSKLLKRWVSEWQDEYQEILKTEIIIENPIKWICDILRFANSNYYNIYAFSNFFYESIGHLNDQRYLALWKILDNMVHDQELLEIGNIIFENNGTTKKKKLKKFWFLIKKHEKNNQARLKLKRYLALLANERLRKKIFDV